MNKLEFGDINKFLTSLGLIFIGFSFLIPWIFIQENKLLVIKSKDLNELTPKAQKIIHHQQDLLLTINQNVLLISTILLIIGLLILMIGIYRWWKRQSVLDEMQNEDLIYKKLQNISTDEKRQSIENEISTTETLSPSKEIDKEVNNYLAIENEIFANINLNYSQNFQIFHNVKIDNFEYDIVLKSKNIELRFDKIVEIKYYKRDINLSILQNALLELIKKCKGYSTELKKKSSGILLVIYDTNELPDKLLKYKIQLQKTGKENGVQTRVQFIRRESLNSIDKIDLFK